MNRLSSVSSPLPHSYTINSYGQHHFLFTPLRIMPTFQEHNYSVKQGLCVVAQTLKQLYFTFQNVPLHNVTLPRRVREIPGSNFGPEIVNNDWSFSWFSSAPHVNAAILAGIMARTRHSTSSCRSMWYKQGYRELLLYRGHESSSFLSTAIWPTARKMLWQLRYLMWFTSHARVCPLTHILGKGWWKIDKKTRDVQCYPDSGAMTSLHNVTQFTSTSAVQ